MHRLKKYSLPLFLFGLIIIIFSVISLLANLLGLLLMVVFWVVGLSCDLFLTHRFYKEDSNFQRNERNLLFLYLLHKTSSFKKTVFCFLLSVELPAFIGVFFLLLLWLQSIMHTNAFLCAGAAAFSALGFTHLFAAGYNFCSYLRFKKSTKITFFNS